MVARLQTKASQIGNILQTLERKYEYKSEHHQLANNNHHNSNGSCLNDRVPVQSSSSCSGESSLSRRQLNLIKFEQLTQRQKQQLLNSSLSATANVSGSASAIKKRLHIKIDAIPPFNPNGSYKKGTISNYSDENKQNQLYLEGDPFGAPTNGFKANKHELQTPLSAKSLKLNCDSIELNQELDVAKSLQQMSSF